MEPYFVNATAGTTVLGSFDPLDEIADVCQKYGIWLHADSAWGGGVLLSRKYKHLMKGIERYTTYCMFYCVEVRNGSKLVTLLLMKQIPKPQNLGK